ncbi:ABC transporter substrate-binding protein [Pueribacillus theae]|uniref:ABC transporter substrate-binding protein n=1 Tax=Pueribacillus theae TaxID=2171751 RepID=A0A2U1JVM1_9BACI|nr:ABC transporter substrate-binding protein [Pueribacillus theae]PWA09257.1 ABC transporter substrate-binding protein [Pueribacillus theae]
MKKVGLFFLMFALFLLASACSSDSNSQTKGSSSTEGAEGKSESSKEGGDLVIGYYSDASSFDPLRASSGGDEALLYFIYDTLINYGPGFEPEPGLAESWEMQDEKTWVLKLREGVTFHDGTEFNAEAVKFNIERANSDASNKADLNMIESVEAVDTHTVALHLSEPNAGLPQALMTAAGMMVSPAAVQEHGDDYALHPAGTGPFKLADRNPNNELRFEKFSEYWQKGKPYLDSVTVKVMKEGTMINALKSGEIHVAAPISATNMGDLENAAGVKVDASASLNFQYIFINTSLAPMDDAKVRQAMHYAIDREQLVQAIQFGQGEPAYGPFPKEHPAFTEEIITPYDKEKAKQLLEESGVESPVLDLLVKPDAFDVRIGEAVKAQLEEVGFQVNLHPTEVTKLVELAFSNPQYPATLARASGRPDPNALLSLYYKEESFYNPGKHKNEKFEALLQQAAAESDEAGRNKLISEASLMIMKEDAMGVPLFFEPLIVAVNEKVHGYEPHLYGKPRFQFLSLEQ